MERESAFRHIENEEFVLDEQRCTESVRRHAVGVADESLPKNFPRVKVETEDVSFSTEGKGLAITDGWGGVGALSTVSRKLTGI